MQIDLKTLETAKKITRKERGVQQLNESPLEKELQQLLKSESGRMPCPFCQDDNTRRKNMYAIIKNQMFFCFRCRQRRVLW